MGDGLIMEYADQHIVLRYDGGFAGLLCAAEEASALTRGRRDGLCFKSEAEDEELFEEPLFIRTDLGHARKLWENAAAKGYAASLRVCFDAYCSDSPGRNNHTGRVLCAILHEAVVSAHGAAEASFARGTLTTLNNLNDPDILSVVTSAARCRNQAQKITGLIRFSELTDGLWYSAISPDCDVLPLIAPHFALRFAPCNFMIHDLRRSTAIVHEPGMGWHIVGSVSLPNSMRVSDLPCTEREFLTRENWRRYFSSIAIEARRNPRLQAGFMPKKYWAGLPEISCDTLKGTRLPSKKEAS
jgi:probable DNA metabolism protein